MSSHLTLISIILSNTMIMNPIITICGIIYLVILTFPNRMLIFQMDKFKRIKSLNFVKTIKTKLKIMEA